MLSVQPCAFAGTKGDSFSCGATTIDPCMGRQCPFYTTGEARAEGREKCWRRLRELPWELQEAIAAKYYQGRVLWGEWA